MFTCRLHSKEPILEALTGLNTPVQCAYVTEPIIALLVGSDHAVLVESTCESAPALTIPNPADFARRIESAALPVNLRESAGQLIVGIVPLTTPAPAPKPEWVIDSQPNPAYTQLASVAHKSLLYGDGLSVVVRNGVAQLAFPLGVSREMLVDLLASETYFTLLNQGRTLSRQSLPALSAYELMRSLPFDLLKLSK